MAVTHEEQLLRVLGEATEPLFPSEITERLNRELGRNTAYTMTEVVMLLKKRPERVEQTPDGRWTLKRRADSNRYDHRV